MACTSTPTYRVENSAQVLSCWLKFALEHAMAYHTLALATVFKILQYWPSVKTGACTIKPITTVIYGLC
jgi:hypothetical protein